MRHHPDDISIKSSIGLADQAQRQRQAVLTTAYHHHPERFVRRHPTPLAVPKEVWINKPATEQNTQ